MRNKLIELIAEGRELCDQIQCEGCTRNCEGLNDCIAKVQADHLLANGVIVPPCKVGDIVYMVTPGGRIHEKKVLGSASVVGLNLRDEIWMKHSFTCESALVFNVDDIGKTVFLTREEAEQALKGEHNAKIH